MREKGKRGTSVRPYRSAAASPLMRRLLAVFAIPIFARLLIGEVEATWTIPSGSAPTASAAIPCLLGRFFYNDAFPPTEDGRQHQEAIDDILNGGATGAANINDPNSTASRSFSGLGPGSMRGATTSVDKSFLQSNGEAYQADLPEGVHFALTKDDGGTRYLYTTTVEIGVGEVNRNGAPEGNWYVPKGASVYPVYRTTLKLNADTGKWESVSSERGHAPAVAFATAGLAFAGGYVPFFDYNAWQAGDLGTGFGDAVVLNVCAAHVTASPPSEDAGAYYRVSLKANQTATVSVSTAGCVAHVYASDASTLVETVSPSVNGSATVTWRTSADADFYVVVSGALQVDFTVSP